MISVHNVGYPKAIGAVSVINHYYGRDDIRLGAFKGDFGDYIGGNYIDDLVDNFDSPIKHYDQVADAVSVLRQTLAEAEVTVIRLTTFFSFPTNDKSRIILWSLPLSASS